MDRLPKQYERLDVLERGPAVGCPVLTGEVAELAKDRDALENVAGRIPLRLHPPDVVLDVGHSNVGSNAIDCDRLDVVALQHDNLRTSWERRLIFSSSLSIYVPAFSAT
jgi:hypothetical protein